MPCWTEEQESAERRVKAEVRQRSRADADSRAASARRGWPACRRRRARCRRARWSPSVVAGRESTIRFHWNRESKTRTAALRLPAYWIRPSGLRRPAPDSAPDPRLGRKVFRQRGQELKPAQELETHCASSSALLKH